MTLVDINRLLEDVQTLNDMPPRLQKLEDAKVLCPACLTEYCGSRRVSQLHLAMCPACVDAACAHCERLSVLTLTQHVQDWSAAVNLLIDGCNRLARQELAQV